MKCNHCNQLIPDESVFCPRCGNKVEASVTENKAFNAMPSEVSKISKKKKGKIIATVLSISLILIITTCIIVFGFFIPNNKYNFAVNLLEDGEYDQAISAFMELEDFRDSKDKISEAGYFKAVELMDNGDYDEAIQAFEKLGDFLDSKDKLSEARYFRAVEYMDNGDYSNAQDIFSKLGSYKDSPDLLYACEYHIVCRWYDADGSLLLENRIKDGEKPIDNPLPTDNDKWNYIKWEESKDSFNNITFTAQREPQNSYFVGNVFQIIVEDLGQTPVATGSAFVFNKDGWFITNAHVVEDAYYLKGIFNIPNNTTKESFTYLEIESGSYYHLEKDIYIGKLKNYQSISNYYKDFSFTQSYAIGQNTYSVGYPNSSADLIISKGEVTNTWSDLYEKLYSGHSYVCSSSSIAPGSSGGILVNENLEILGMTTLGWFDDNGKFISGAAISAYNYENLLKTNATESSLIPHMERFHSDEKVYIGYYNEARDDEKNGLTERVNVDDGSVIYVYEWTDEETNSDGVAYTCESSLAVSSNGFMSYDSMYYWGSGNRREISFYGYYSNTRGLDNFVFEFKYTYADGEVEEVRCDDINYSPNLSLTLNKAYVVDAPYSYKISEDEYMKKNFNFIYEWLRDDMARFK